MPPEEQTALHDELADRLAAVLAELLDAERRAVARVDEKKRADLRARIARREAQVQNSAEMDLLFEEHLSRLPDERKPRGKLATGLEAYEWLNTIRSESARWRDELAAMESRPLDKRSIFNSARDKATRALVRQAHGAGLLPEHIHADVSKPDGKSTESLLSYDPIPDGWYSLSDLGRIIPVSGRRRPIAVRFPDDRERPCGGGQSFYREVVDWLVAQGHFADEKIDSRLERYIFPPQKRRDRSKALSNGMWLYTDENVNVIVERVKLFVRVCNEDVRQFYVRLSNTGR